MTNYAYPEQFLENMNKMKIIIKNTINPYD